jgi:acyl-CoA thioester hydrolase
VEDAGRLGPQRGSPRPTVVTALSAFRYYLRVRYVECDAQKVVFNSRYGEYVDVGINEFIRALGLLDEFITGPLDFQLVKQTVEWKAPARFDEVLELSIAATRLGTTSFTVATAFRIAGREAVIVSVETVYVLVDARTLTKMPLPDSLRNALLEGASGRITDHAGHISSSAVSHT